MLLSRQVRPGDFIRLGSGEEGYVQDVTWRYTTIRQLPNNITVVPNAKLASAVTTNYYLPEREMSVLVQVGVAYGSDLPTVERVTVEVVNQTGADGLAREVVRRLRRAGIDVVNYGSARDSTADSTTILIRRGDSTAAAPVRQALGLGRIRVDLDPRLLLDASVLVGPDLARSLGFHP